jgi:hypothetical protein
MANTPSLKNLDLTGGGVEQPQTPSFRYIAQYGGDKAICGLISIMGLLTIVAGAPLIYFQVLEITQSSYDGKYIAFSLAIAIAFNGLVIIAVGQIGRAIFDNANANLERLALLKWQIKSATSMSH